MPQTKQYLTAEEFITAYMKAYKENKTADELGVTLKQDKNYVINKYKDYTRKGVHLPELKKVLPPNRIDVSAMNDLIGKLEN